MVTNPKEKQREYNHRFLGKHPEYKKKYKEVCECGISIYKHNKKSHIETYRHKYLILEVTKLDNIVSSQE